MNKGIVCVALMMVLSMVSAGFAAEGELTTTVDVAYVTKYIWRGIDLLDDMGAVQPSIDIDLYGTGLSLNVWSSFAGGSKGKRTASLVDAEEWNYTLTYANAINEGESTQVNYGLWWRYYDFPDVASRNADAQEIALAVSMPNLCPSGIVPSYAVIMMWPAQGGGAARDLSGFIHVFGLSKAVECPATGQVFNLGWDITYNDGAGIPGATGIDHDWSHTTWNISTSFDVAGGKLTPSLHYQASMEDTVNREDELWAGVSYSLGF